MQAGHPRKQRGDRRLGVRDDRGVGLVDLVDLADVDVDVDELLVLEQIVAKAEGRVLGEGIADRQDQVGGEKCLARRLVAAVAEHADRQRMVLGNDALAVERRDEGNLVALEQRLQLRTGIAADRPEADQRQHRLALRQGVGQHIGDLGDPRRDPASIGFTRRSTSR